MPRLNITVKYHADLNFSDTVMPFCEKLQELLLGVGHGYLGLTSLENQDWIIECAPFSWGLNQPPLLVQFRIFQRLGESIPDTEKDDRRRAARRIVKQALKDTLPLYHHQNGIVDVAWIMGDSMPVNVVGMRSGDTTVSR